nr:hypothetical protein GCM10025732_43960 [Glycomyces mayteni]
MARTMGPLYLAGFTTAFGAHGVASVLGAESDDIGLTLLGLGAVLALYDVAEVVLKPVFGVLSDRVGAKPVIVGGLAAFVLASLTALIDPTPLVFAIARLGQGAAAAAFSPRRRRRSRAWRAASGSGGTSAGTGPGRAWGMCSARSSGWA